jgi:hypothetical protein
MSRLLIAVIDLLDTLAPLPASWKGVTIPFCSPGTRESLLEDIWVWVQSPARHPCVLWMSGLAGTGKSTIARELCRRLEENHLLGASFFISRQEAARRDPLNIIRSLAFQLAHHDRLVAQALCAELRARPITVDRTLDDQVTSLVVDPARTITASSGLILVIDALDESFVDARGRHGGDLLLFLVRGILKLSGRVRLFITSRNERPIEHMFDQLSTSAQQTVVKLQDLDTNTVQGDIQKYLTRAFREICVELIFTIGRRLPRSMVW